MCAVCLHAEHEALARLRAYLKAHPDQTVAGISESTQIPPERILRWLREGRLEVVRPDVDLTCERCGRKLVAGRLCALCRGQMAQSIKEAFTAAQAPQRFERPRRERRRIPRDGSSQERFDLR